MVVGIDKFREHFAGHEEQYALIGGTACDLLFANAGIDFRATKDFDMVLCVEVVDEAFAAAFAAFLEGGGYEARQKSDGHKEYFRFHKPADKTYPYMIELFSRKPGGIEIPDEHDYTKVPVDEDDLSLSAILLDEHYYAALQDSRIVIDGISLLTEDLLIPFKAKAYLDLAKRKDDGDQISDKQIKKHRNDVFRLAQLLPADLKVDLADSIREDLRAFLGVVSGDESFDPKAFGVDFTRDDGVALLQNAYGIVK